MVPRSDSVAQSGQIPPNWFDMVYQCCFPSITFVDDYTTSSPTSVEVPNHRPADAVRYNIALPIDLRLRERYYTQSGHAGEDRVESIVEPYVIVTSTFFLFANHLYMFTYEMGFHRIEYTIPTEPMTLMTHVSGKLILIPNKPTTDKCRPAQSTSRNRDHFNVNRLHSDSSTQPACDPVHIFLLRHHPEALQSPHKHGPYLSPPSDSMLHYLSTRSHGPTCREPVPPMR